MKKERINILVVGIFSVGKGSLVKRFTHDTFDDKNLLITNISKTFKLNDDQELIVNFFIHNRSEKFYQLRPNSSQLQLSKAIILVYDISFHYSLIALNDALEHLNKYISKEVPIILIGNKIDLIDREVTTEEGKKFASDNKLLAFYEASAKENINVKEAFNEFLEKIKQVYSIFPYTKGKNIIQLEKNKNNKDNKSCIK